ncbi:methylenetetrahydrofolate reductase-domain-containing protein [Irpex rosettiformis]|uniref:Methylenetetrahydrofolate reductase-domain-containing protein n=1 Tax=Irpex rosettiformis TaxID=378272 RepID=A0ACB8UIA8_9APHY|nr:methylenetetrahydrofolate reductase-domain-containing protein [Irpex rosettiformis]
MKLSEKIASYKGDRPFFTLEFFPPKTDQGFENLVARIGRLSSLHPLAISITWGAGGSTSERSLDLSGLVQEEYGIETIMHLTCTNMEKGSIDAALKSAKERGITNILALRGDPPRGDESWIPTDVRFQHGVDLVSYIREQPEYADFTIGVAAYPDGHTESDESEEHQIGHLKQKIDAGADYIITQLFYDVDGFLRWEKKVRAKGITVPIIPGIMPIQTYATFMRLTKLCGTRVPGNLMSDLVEIRHDDQKVKDYGVKLAIEMIRRLTTEADISGVHFSTLNLEKSVQRVIDGLGWIERFPSVLKPVNKLIAEVSGTSTPGTPTAAQIGLVQRQSQFTISPHTAAGVAASQLTAIPPRETEPGKGELNNAATWDDFPNGRFGDFKSPAYGDPNPWGASTISRNQALAQWGNPRTEEDISRLFIRYLHSKLATTPFSPVPLSPESLVIIRHLERLTERGWWTVGSQPAIDGADSSDEVVGWGPKGGYVYQKSFVEFFVEKEDVDRIEKRVQEQGQGWVNYFAANLEGDLRTNVTDDGRNAVTWGVFPGQEVAQSTIIEKESFLAWKEEAFGIWAEWASYYSPDSDERKLLDNIRQKRWLVSVIHHDFKKPEALWSFLYGIWGHTEHRQ